MHMLSYLTALPLHCIKSSTPHPYLTPHSIAPSTPLLRPQSLHLVQVPSLYPILAYSFL
ncbi:hypothetical protein HMPREF9134_01136 [Porphyromonas catoniae F0037]|uniref:Uncharacterized protein n=1 Tax=Porphyromonas catoniae F0037 TaxID=1127696 RepID=L1NCV3_9PORP|nr:hypothetical protein HMPREF9134_01136 [Porphyromonas catoniae F0037]